MLTYQQRKLLTYIVDYTAINDGLSPSFDDMKDALGLKSKSGIHRLIEALQERGFIKRLPHRARAIEVLRHPGQANPRRCPTCGQLNPHHSAGQSPASPAPTDSANAREN